jgi:hypothetical protein
MKNAVWFSHNKPAVGVSPCGRQILLWALELDKAVAGTKYRCHHNIGDAYAVNNTGHATSLCLMAPEPVIGHGIRSAVPVQLRRTTAAAAGLGRQVPTTEYTPRDRNEILGLRCEVEGATIDRVSFQTAPEFSLAVSTGAMRGMTSEAKGPTFTGSLNDITSTPARIRPTVAATASTRNSKSPPTG